MCGTKTVPRTRRMESKKKKQKTKFSSDNLSCEKLLLRRTFWRTFSCRVSGLVVYLYCSITFSWPGTARACRNKFHAQIGFIDYFFFFFFIKFMCQNNRFDVLVMKEFSTLHDQQNLFETQPSDYPATTQRLPHAICS